VKPTLSIYGHYGVIAPVQAHVQNGNEHGKQRNSDSAIHGV